MKTNISLRQFVKDGLLIVLVVLIIFVIITLLGWRMLVGYGVVYGLTDFSDFFSFVLVPMFSFPELSGGGRFLSPMPFVILTAFIGVGIGGRFLETITFRKDWIIPVLIISVTSWLAGLAMIVMLFGFGMGWNFIMDIGGFIGTGAGIGFSIASALGAIFNPNGRLYKIMIGAIASAIPGYGVCLWIYFLQIP